MGKTIPETAQRIVRNERSYPMKPLGPRGSMGAKGIRIGDLALVTLDSGEQVLAKVTGGYQLGARWIAQIGHPPGVREEETKWTPQSVPLRAIRQAWGPRR